MTKMNAKERLQKAMESGDRKELDKCVSDAYEDTDMAIAILDILLPVPTEEEE